MYLLNAICTFAGGLIVASWALSATGYTLYVALLSSSQSQYWWLVAVLLIVTVVLWWFSAALFNLGARDGKKAIKEFKEEGGEGS